MNKHTRSNQNAFLSFRKEVEAHKVRIENELHYRHFLENMLLVSLLSKWEHQYERRMIALFRWSADKLDPILRDSAAVELLKRRHYRDNLDCRELPGFDEETIQLVNQVVFSTLGLDVKSFSEVPVYGKSFQRMLRDAFDGGCRIDEPTALVNYFVDAGVSLSPVWKRDDERRAAGLPEVEPEVTRRLSIAAKWQQTQSLEIPWEAKVGDEKWEVRLNDFPDEWMYSLIVDGVVLGDFHDWPRNWDRGEEYWPEEPVPRKKAKVSRTVKVSAETWMSRYEAGQCVAVWSEMVSLGEDVRKKTNRPYADAVAKETMARASRNIKTIIERLESMQFVPKYGSWGEPMPEGEIALIAKAEKAGLLVPLSLREMMTQIGMVSFLGTHPAIAPAGGVVAVDGLEVPSGLGWEAFVENWIGTPKAEREGEEYEVFPDAESKREMMEETEPDGWLSIVLPNGGADAVLNGDEQGRRIVEYLRWSLSWGGFPGWEKEKARPEKELRILSEGLLPI